MAIINCQHCNKRISDISPVCPHCGRHGTEQDDERTLELKRRSSRDRIYHLKMISYGVITLFMVAFGWYWWDTGGFQRRSGLGPLVLSGVVALAYLWIRFQLIRARKELKRLLKPRHSARL